MTLFGDTPSCFLLPPSLGPCFLGEREGGVEYIVHNLKYPRDSCNLETDRKYE